ncbi:MAG: hypothetical protein OXD37_00960, partial [Acidimicrobiaceae bacterium]|nr:hypothetical protein [Acidimicrobiaceae bacterium]
PEEAPPEEPPTDQTDTGPVPVFEDIDSAAPAHRESVTELTDDGTLDDVGCDDDRLCPRQPINTWQFAVILLRRIDNQQTPDSDTSDADDDGGSGEGAPAGDGADSGTETPGEAPDSADEGSSDEGTPSGAGDTPDSDTPDADAGDAPDSGTGTADAGDEPGADDWWAPYLQRLADLGVVTICGDGSDTTDGDCVRDMLTRAQAARLIAIAYNLPDADDSAGFDDTADNPHAAAIDALHAAGITIGCTAEPLSFCPDQPISRQEAATMITRATGLKRAAG